MIVLDTNVVSAVMSRQPPLPVIRWLNDQPLDRLGLTSINLLELRFGAETAKEDVTRLRLHQRLDWFLHNFIGSRVLPMDGRAAETTAALGARLQKMGRPVGREDTMIAGICLAHGATLATRNIRHFADAGLVLIDPWGEAAGT